MSSPRYIAKWELENVRGTVVIIDVLRAFTTAAYAFASGASSIWLVSSVDEALALAGEIPNALTMGEVHGKRPSAFDFSNSPVGVAAADLEGRVLVQRTSAGTQGAIAARHADRMFAASLVCASATADALRTVSLDAPTYVITGRFPDTPDGGEDDLATAQLIERARRGLDLQIDNAKDAVANSRWAKRLAQMGSDDVHPDDVTYSIDVDRFSFAMEVERVEGRLRLAVRKNL